MNRRIYIPVLALALAGGTIAAAAGLNQLRTAQAAPTSSTTSTTRAAAADTLAMLPASDAIVYVDVRRLLTDALPSVLAGNPAKLAQLNTEIEKIKTKTGLDVRSFDRVAIGVPYSNPSSAVAIARGSFNADALVAAGRIYANGKFTEQKYNGKTIYNFPVTEKAKKPGAASKVKQVYVAALDANTLAIGMDTPTGVRAALDASAGMAANRAGSELAALASRNADALVGFSGNVPASVLAKSNFGNEEINRAVSSVQKFYGSLNATAGNIEALVSMITGNPDQAKTLGDTLAALKQFSGIAVSHAPADSRVLVQSFFDSLQITPQGNEVQIKVALPTANLAPVVRKF